MDERITRLKNLRRGKKASLTKRLTKIKQMVSDGKASRTKLKFLMTAAYECLRAVTLDCNELFELVTDPDSEWLEDLKSEVDDCAAEVKEHVEARAEDDVSSGASLTDSWVRDHAPMFSEVGMGGGMESDAKAVSFDETSNPVVSAAVTSSVTNTYSLFGSDVLPTSSSTAHNPDDWRSKDARYWKDYFTERSTRSALQSGAISPDMSWLGPQKAFDSAPGGLSYPLCTSSMPASNLGYAGSRLPSPHRHAGTSFANTGGIPSSIRSSPSAPNEVDSWIDRLDERVESRPTVNPSTEMDMASFFVQQTLPRTKIPVFDGSPLDWVAFISKFHNLVHNQSFIPASRKLMYLQEHLQGEPMTSIKGYPDTWAGYVSSLKTIKFMFGQRTNVAQAVLGKVTQGKPIQDDDENGLTEFFYTVTECLVTLNQLNYESDIRSSETLRQTVARLPTYLQRKWAERSHRIRDSEIPNMLHFQKWFRDCILIRKEACWPTQQRKKTSTPGSKDTPKLSAGTFSEKPGSCPLCKGSHYLGRCDKYTPLTEVEKLQIVQRLKVCFNCIKPGHPLKDCTSEITCKAADCGEKHHTSIHKVYKELEEKAKSKSNGGADDTKVVSLLRSPKEVYLLVVPVLIHPPAGEPVLTYALLDNCSQSTLLRDDMARKLNLRGNSDILNIGTIKDKAEGIPVECISLEISSQDKKFRTTIEEVSVVPASRLHMPGRPRLADMHDPDLFTHLDDVDINPISSESITMLIGANLPDAVLTLDVRRGSNNQPLAVKTVFGWTLFGPAATTSSLPPNIANVSCLFTSRAPAQHISSTVACLWEDNNKPGSLPGVNVERSDERLLELVEGFWSQEIGPIAPGKDVAPSREDEEASKKLDEATVLVDGHYQVPMLWKTDSVKLPNNKAVALKRFKYLLTKLRKDPELYAKYKETFEKYIEKGYARRMTSDEAAHTTDRTWYVPHHPVFNPKKPDKFRVVKDAAAPYQGTGLNLSLKAGPDLLRSLTGVLNRFRTSRIAIVADVAEMFHQVRVSAEDADSLRFLWTDDIHSNIIYTMQMLVHIFGATSSPTCANYALKRTARDNMNNFDPLTIETVLKSFYMDDLLKSVDSLEVAKNYLKNS